MLLAKVLEQDEREGDRLKKELESKNNELEEIKKETENYSGDNYNRNKLKLMIEKIDNLEREVSNLQQSWEEKYKICNKIKETIKLLNNLKFY